MWARERRREGERVCLGLVWFWGLGLGLNFNEKNPYQPEISDLPPAKGRAGLKKRHGKNVGVLPSVQ